MRRQRGLGRDGSERLTEADWRGDGERRSDRKRWRCRWQRLTAVLLGLDIHSTPQIRRRECKTRAKAERGLEGSLRWECCASNLRLAVSERITGWHFEPNLTQPADFLRPSPSRTHKQANTLLSMLKLKLPETLSSIQVYSCWYITFTALFQLSASLNWIHSLLYREDSCTSVGCGC